MKKILALIVAIVAFVGSSFAQTDVPTGVYTGSAHVGGKTGWVGALGVDTVVHDLDVAFYYFDDYWLDMRDVNLMGNIISMEMRRIQVSEIDGGWNLHRSGFEEFIIPEVYFHWTPNDYVEFRNVLAKMTLNSGSIIAGILALDFNVQISLNVGLPLGTIAVDIPVVYTSYSSVTIESEAPDATGEGLYREGAVVTIFAGTPPEGMQFKEWIVEPEIVALYNATDALTWFFMPESSITLTALFEEEDAPVSVPETSSDAIIIYPTIISDGNIHIKGLEPDAYYNVYSLTGMVLKSGTTSGTINVSELNKGFYLLNVTGKVAKFYIIK